MTHIELAVAEIEALATLSHMNPNEWFVCGTGIEPETITKLTVKGFASEDGGKWQISPMGCAFLAERFNENESGAYATRAGD